MKPPVIAQPTRREVAHADALRKSAIVNPDARGVIQGRRYSLQAVEGYLDLAAARAKHRNPHGLGASILGWVAEAREAIHTKDWMKTKTEIAIAASRGDEEGKQLFAEAVKLVTSNFVAAVSNWGAFFQRESLGDSQWPMLVAERPGMQMTIHTIGQDGGNRTIQSQPGTLDGTPVPLFVRSSHWIEYALRDLYRGDVQQAALAQFDVAMDRLDRTEELLASYLIYGGSNTRLVASFTTTGNEWERDYYANRRVNTSNLPAGNFVTLAGNSTSSLFRKEVFDAVVQYFSSWGAGVIENGTLAPVEIVVASKHINDFLAQVGFSTAANSLAEQVFENGYVVNYAGRNWTVVGDNTLDPNNGVAYVRSNLPVGVAYDKPSFEQVIQDTDSNLVVQNKGRVCEQWVEGFGMPLHWRKHTFGVRYMTPT
jgi:hypothetical protein